MKILYLHQRNNTLIHKQFDTIKISKNEKFKVSAQFFFSYSFIMTSKQV